MSAVKAATAGFGPQPGAATIETRDHSAQAFQLEPLGRLQRRGVLVLQQRQHAGKVFAVSVQELLALFRFEFRQRLFPVL